MTIPFPLTPMAMIICEMYKFAKSVNGGIDKLIGDMKGSENPAISRTGRVLEAAKLGFGLGYITPVVIIAVGQLLLGNNLVVVVGKAAAMALPNPVSMTCAAIGAILYGWNALSKQERGELLEKLSKGLEVGIELIKSIVHFVIETSKKMLSSENLEEIKQFIESTAIVFGKTIGDVTHKFTDIVSDSYGAVKKKTSVAVDKTVDVASDAYRVTSETAGRAAGNILEAAGNVAGEIRKKAKKVVSKAPTNADKS